MFHIRGESNLIKSGYSRSKLNGSHHCHSAVIFERLPLLGISFLSSFYFVSHIFFESYTNFRELCEKLEYSTDVETQKSNNRI